MATSAIGQLIAMELVDRYEEFVDIRVRSLRPGADLVVDVLRSELSDWSFVPVRGGLSVWAELPEHTSATAFVQHATRHGVLIASGRQFYAADMDCANVRIPFTAPLAQLERGMERLVEAWRTFDSEQSARF